MRHLAIALAAVSLLGIGATIPSPAAAAEYPYCLQGRQTGVPGDCQYRSYRECMASASGRAAYCSVNPRYAFDRRGGNQRWR
jgi:hypothetical protein